MSIRPGGRNILILPPQAGLSGLWEGFMSRTRQLGWVAALAAAVFAAGPQANGQEPQPPVNIDFEEVVAAARNAGAHHGPGNNFRDFNEVTRQRRRPRACSRCTRRVTTSTPRSGPISST